MSERTRWRRPVRGLTNGVGIYDREYYRQERFGFGSAVSRSAVLTIILVNAAVYIAELLFGDNLILLLSAHTSTLTQPWMWWQFLTYGFVHDPNNFAHILGNMAGLFFLGRDVEEWYGKKEFTRLYLVLLVVGSVAWAIVNRVNGLPGWVPLMGASGAVTGVVVLYALLFPRNKLLFMFFIPMPAWVLGLMVVIFDIVGATGHGDVIGGALGQDPHVNIAYAVHLAGAAFAFIYFRQRWNFGRMFQGRFHWPSMFTRSRLRVHRPDEDEEQGEVAEEEVDRILEKIHRKARTVSHAKSGGFLKALAASINAVVISGNKADCRRLLSLREK